MNCTEVFILLLSIAQLSVYAICTAWQEETVLRTKMALTAPHRLVVVYRYADIVRAYPFFWAWRRKLSVLCMSCNSYQFCVLAHFSNEFLLKFTLFPASFWMNLMLFRGWAYWEKFSAPLFKKTHVVDTTQAKANCVQNENGEGHALCAVLAVGLSSQILRSRMPTRIPYSVDLFSCSSR